MTEWLNQYWPWYVIVPGLLLLFGLQWIEHRRKKRIEREAEQVKQLFEQAIADKRIVFAPGWDDHLSAEEAEEIKADFENGTFKIEGPIRRVNSDE